MGAKGIGGNILESLEHFPRSLQRIGVVDRRTPDEWQSPLKTLLNECLVTQALARHTTDNSAKAPRQTLNEIKVWFKRQHA
jgi:hypothetical protein